MGERAMAVQRADVVDAVIWSVEVMICLPLDSYHRSQRSHKEQSKWGPYMLYN